MPVRPFHVAAVQIANRPGAVAENLSKAAGLVAQAARTGAELVLLPELMATGYRIAPDIWETAEPIGGPISTWLLETAKLHRIHLGHHVHHNGHVHTFVGGVHIVALRAGGHKEPEEGQY